MGLCCLTRKPDASGSACATLGSWKLQLATGKSLNGSGQHFIRKCSSNNPLKSETVSNKCSWWQWDRLLHCHVQLNALCDSNLAYYKCICTFSGSEGVFERVPLIAWQCEHGFAPPSSYMPAMLCKSCKVARLPQALAWSQRSRCRDHKHIISAQLHLFDAARLSARARRCLTRRSGSLRRPSERISHARQYATAILQSCEDHEEPPTAAQRPISPPQSVF